VLGGGSASRTLRRADGASTPQRARSSPRSTASDARTRGTLPWARTEEQAIERAQLAWIRGSGADGTLVAAPWLDVYWRRV
jgi:hypothetical protein